MNRGEIGWRGGFEVLRRQLEMAFEAAAAAEEWSAFETRRLGGEDSEE